MVPLPKTSLGRPILDGPNRDYYSTGAGFFRQRRPLITYGKKDSKSLSLTGSYFKCNTYTPPPPDEDSSDQDADSQAEAEARAILEAADDGDVESELFDKPDEAVPPDVVDPGQVPPSVADGVTFSWPIVLSSTKNTVTGTSSSTTSKRKLQLENPAEESAGTKRSRHKKSASAPAKTSRRLPVSELQLVHSPIDYTDFGSPPSSLHGIQTQDPINEKGPEHAGESPVSLELEPKKPENQRRPSMAFKDRLQLGKFRHKSMVDLRKKRAKQLFRCPNDQVAWGDGFDERELYINPLARRTVKRRRRQRDALIVGFNALQIRSGPLPEVKFEQPQSQLEVEPGAATPQEKQAHEPPRTGRHVSFSDRARKDAIVAQLSAVSAPPAPHVEYEHYDDDDDEAEEEEEEEDDDAEKSSTGDQSEEDLRADKDQIADGFQAATDQEVYDADTEFDQKLQDRAGSRAPTLVPAAVSYASGGFETAAASEGVSLDFRRLAPGQRPRRRIRQNTLIEVSDRIVEMTDTDTLFPPPCKFPIDASQVQPQATITTPEMRQARDPPRKRPRSILKNGSSTVERNTTQAEHTAANTRRNSAVELSESRYFTDAADMLRRADPTKHKIVPRRRSSYFDDVQMPDNQAVVPETSTPDPDVEMQDDGATSDLAVLRRTSEAEWTSQSLPGVPRDLRTLTRSVSRGYGTLSQSARRRPNLPFQSPRKVK